MSISMTNGPKNPAPAPGANPKKPKEISPQDKMNQQKMKRLQDQMDRLKKKTPISEPIKTLAKSLIAADDPNEDTQYLLDSASDKLSKMGIESLIYRGLDNAKKITVDLTKTKGKDIHLYKVTVRPEVQVDDTTISKIKSVGADFETLQRSSKGFIEVFFWDKYITPVTEPGARPGIEAPVPGRP